MWWQWQALWEPSRNPRNEKLSAHSTNVRQGRAIALGSQLHSVIICLHLMPLDIIRFENFSCSFYNMSMEMLHLKQYLHNQYLNVSISPGCPWEREDEAKCCMVAPAGSPLLSSCDGDHMARHMVHIVHHIVASYSHTYGAYGTICNTTLLNITTGSPIKDMKS